MFRISFVKVTPFSSCRVVFEKGMLPVPPTSTAWPPLTPRLPLPEAEVKSTMKPAPAPLKSPWTTRPE